MPGRPSPRALAARRSSAEQVRESAALLRTGEPLNDRARTALVDLLEHVAGPACESVPTTVWERTSRLALEVQPDRGAPDLPPPNVGGGVSRQLNQQGRGDSRRA